MKKSLILQIHDANVAAWFQEAKLWSFVVLKEKVYPEVIKANLDLVLVTVLFL